MSDKGRHRRKPRVSTVADRRHRPWTTWFAAVALLFHALLPLLHTPPRPEANAGVPAWVFGSICRSAAAIAPISADDKQQQAPAKSAPFCPICQSAQISGTFLPPQSVAVPPPSLRVGRTDRLPPTDTFASARPDRLHPARAPPFAG